jgi:hypothetical protein
MERAAPIEKSDPRRIAACLKACEGIPTEKLEDGVLLRLVAACIHLDDQQVRDVLEELSPNRPRLVKPRK